MVVGVRNVDTEVALCCVHLALRVVLRSCERLEGGRVTAGGTKRGVHRDACE